MINPSLVGLKEWADSLIVDYPDQNVPILLFEMDWQRWASELIKSSIFSNSSIPNPHNLIEWREWARWVYGILQ
jgi:hypothetical protein